MKEPLPVSYARDALPDEVKILIEKQIEIVNEAIWNEAKLGATSAFVKTTFKEQDLHLMPHLEKRFRDAGYEVKHLGTRYFEVSW